MKTCLTGMLMIMLLLFGLSSLVLAERFVVVNGQRLTLSQIRTLERLHCGPIPNGHFWLSRKGIWGYEGNPIPQGHIQDNCRRSQRRPSLSERGLLFSPRDFIR